MKPSEDYPRMMFHRTKEAVTVLSREEEDGLGPDWSRVIWQAQLFAAPEPAPEPEPEPEPQSEGYTESEPEKETAPAANPTRPARAPMKRPAAHSKRKRTA
jgi:hypothetical protein